MWAGTCTGVLAQAVHKQAVRRQAVRKQAVCGQAVCKHQAEIAALNKFMQYLTGNN